MQKELENIVINEYKDGKSILSISKNRNIPYSQIQSLLINNDIKIRGGRHKIYFSPEEDEKIVDLVSHHYNIKTISESLNKTPETIRRRAKELHLTFSPNQKNHNLNELYFHSIDTEEKAYFLGLMYTDGNIRTAKDCPTRKSIRISLQLQDKIIIEKFLSALNSNVNLQYDKRVGKETIGFEILNSQLYDDLFNLGVIPNKTYESFHLPNVSKEFLIPFLRGLFDGDGVLSYKENYNEASVGFVNYHESCVREFQELIDKLIGKKIHNKISYKNCDGTSYRCSWRGRRQVLAILSLLYDNSNIYLERKYSKYKKLLSTVADNDIV